MARLKFTLERFWLLGLLALAFVAVTLRYSLNTPLFEGSDEPAHFAYVLSLARGPGLPILQANPQQVTSEAHQPPLYYALCALVMGWVDDADDDSLLRANPNTGFDPLDLTNKNLYLHSSREDFPYSGAVLAMRLARLVSLAFGLGALLATFALARVLVPGRPWLWYGSAAFLAFVPQFNFVSGVISNDSAAAFVAALALWQLARLVVRLNGARIETGMATAFVLLGVLLSAAALVKESGLVVAPFSVAVLSLAGWQNRRRIGWRVPTPNQSSAWAPWRVIAGGIFIVVVTMALLTGWWFVARHATMGFWFGTSEAAAPSAAPLTLDGIVAQWTELEISFWGLFGWNMVPLPQPLYDGLHVLALLALAGVVLELMRRQSATVERAWMVALAVFALVVLIVFLRWMSATHQAHGRLLFVALPAFAILCCWGIASWLPRRVQPAIVPLLGLCWIAGPAWAGITALDSAYPRAPLLSAAALPADMHPINANLGDRIELLGYQAHFGRAGAADLVEVIPYWRATAPVDLDYTVTVQVFDEQGTRIGHLDTFPMRGMSLTHDWHTGDIVQDDYPVVLDSHNMRPLRVTIVIGMYDSGSGRALQVIQPDGRHVARVSLGQLVIND